MVFFVGQEFCEVDDCGLVAYESQDFGGALADYPFLCVEEGYHRKYGFSAAF